ncbi:hypothetical protein GCM10017624_04660 [Azotobacter vinelandii]|nr:hypothetical protein GCM10017624_04660 [Azotobacter vinelandii]
MGGDEDGHPVLARQLDQQFPEVVPRDRVDAGGGFVEDQDFRVVQHRHGQREALAHAQRQLFGQAVADLAQVEAVEHFADARRALRLGEVEQAGVQLQVLQDRQFAVEGERLGHVAHPPARVDVLRVHRLAEQQGLALAGRQQAGEHLHGGGFAAAVGAEEAEDFPAFDAEVHVVHRDEVAEAAGQAMGLDGGLAAVGGQRRDLQGVVAAALLLGQQGDEGGLQVGAAGAGEDLAGAAGVQDLAVVHDHQPVETLRLVHVGGGHQHTHAGAVVADAFDQFPELAARQRVDAGGGFVEDQQVGVVDQRTAEAELLLHAAGELARRPLGERRQAGAAGQVGDACVALRPVLAEQAAEELQVLAHGQRRVEVLAQPLGHVGDARADPAAVGGVGHVAVQHTDAALLDTPRAGDQRQQAGLADAVRTDQAHHAVGGDFQVEPVQGASPAIAQGDPGKLGDAAHGTRLTCRWVGHSSAGSSFT